jgi:hypothetical protein
MFLEDPELKGAWFGTDLRWSLRINFLLQTGQVKFFSPVWVRVWRASSSERAKRFPHAGQTQGNGRSPEKKKIEQSCSMHLTIHSSYTPVPVTHFQRPSHEVIYACANDIRINPNEENSQLWAQHWIYSEVFMDFFCLSISGMGSWSTPGHVYDREMEFRKHHKNFAYIWTTVINILRKIQYYYYYYYSPVRGCKLPEQ